jgi:hypothetical protein
MLKIKRSIMPGDTRIRWQCPNCLAKDVFFIQQPFSCPVCKWILPAFDLLESTKKVRVRFFRTTDDI